MKELELLAPAGSLKTLKAVIHAGADAVYLGGSMFGARAYANNFNEEELLEAIRFGHIHGRKIILAVNTLLKEYELGQLYDYLHPYYEAGLDAVIVQDMGVMEFIKTHFPNLPIHTSTQMTITNVEGARLLKEQGVERVVTAREMSLEEIQRIHDEVGVELESFIHGALCYCYSGQCLLSSMLGGRSGNRGRCAQPCRLPYAVLDEKHREYKKDAYVLSLKDMCGIKDLRGLADAGVYSLKIEGRMKQIPYAAGVVSYYRKYIDLFLSGQETQVSEGDYRAVLALGNRCGFTDGYYHRHNGSDMVTFTKPNYEKTNEALQQQILRAYENGAAKIPVMGELVLHQGQAAYYRVKTQTVSAEISGMEVMQAQKKPLLAEDVKSRMEKTGDTPFVMEDLSIRIEDGVFLPNGALNQLRREALAELQKEMLKPYQRQEHPQKTAGEKFPEACEKREKRKERVFAVTGERRQLAPVLESSCVTSVCLDMEAYDRSTIMEELKEDANAVMQKDKEVYLAMPRIFRAGTAEWVRQILPDIKRMGFAGVLVRNYEELALAKETFLGSEIITDHNLYCYNDQAVRAFAGQGVTKNTVPLELNRSEIKRRYNEESMMMLYGYYPLMTSAQCVHANTRGCDKKRGLSYLKDRYQVQFPVKNFCTYCYNVVYNSLPVLLFSNLEELKKAGIRDFRMDFTMESAKETKAILKLYEEFADGSRRQYPKEWENRYTNGHYKRGVE